MPIAALTLELGIEHAHSLKDRRQVVRSMKDEKETQIIKETLESTGWNRRIAAEKLQISYKALLYKLKQIGFEGYGA